MVISPAVDLAAFNRSSLLATGPPQRHPACSNFSQGADPQGSGLARSCVHVGFLARLSTEKNVNLFVFAAYELLKVRPFYRFSVFGKNHCTHSYTHTYTATHD